MSSLSTEHISLKPVLEIMGVMGSALINTTAKLSISSSSLYKILKDREISFRNVDMIVKLADGSIKKETVAVC